MLKKLAYICVFAMAVILFEGSCKKPGNCPEVKPHFDIAGIELKFYAKYNSVNGVLNDSAEVRKHIIDLKIIIHTVFIARNIKHNFSLIPVAYANDDAYYCPGNGLEGMTEQIDSLYIVPESFRIQDASGWLDTLYSMHQDFPLHLTNGRNVRFVNFYLPRDSSGYHFSTHHLSYYNYSDSGKFLINILEPNPDYYIKTSSFQRLKLVLKLVNGERYEAYSQAVMFI